MAPATSRTGSRRRGVITLAGEPDDATLRPRCTENRPWPHREVTPKARNRAVVTTSETPLGGRSLAEEVAEDRCQDRRVSRVRLALEDPLGRTRDGADDRADRGCSPLGARTAVEAKRGSGDLCEPVDGDAAVPNQGEVVRN